MQRLNVFIISLICIFFAAGCLETEPQPPEPAPAETAKTEPLKIEPAAPEITRAPQEKTSESNQPQLPVPAPPQTKPEPVRPAPAQEKAIEPQPPKPVDSPADDFHKQCSDILADYVTGDGKVNYRMLKRKKSQLRKLLEKFDKLNSGKYNKWSNHDKIAFWINAYNLQLLRIIIDNYPIESSRILRILWPPDSIRHIDKNIGGIKKQKFIVMDEEFTLESIEQRLFQQQFDEPRAFLALSGATISSPALRNEPYFGQSLDEQLNDQAQKFLARPDAFRIDREKQKVYISAIFHPGWFAGSFIEKYGTDKKFKDHPPATRAVLNFITNYIPEPDVYFLETAIYSIEYIKFNWRLNE